MSTKYVRGEDTPFTPQQTRSPRSGTSLTLVFLIGGGVLLFISVVVFVILLSKKKPGDNPVPQVPVTPTPTIVVVPTITPEPSPLPAPARIDIHGVSVLDIMSKNPDKLPNGTYLLERNDDFQIVYNQETAEFALTILQPNFVVARQRAEERLLALLGIGEDEVCPLTVVVATPASVNKTYAGLTFGLSYCE